MRWKLIAITLKPDIIFLGGGSVYNRFDDDFKAYVLYVLSSYSHSPVQIHVLLGRQQV